MEGMDIPVAKLLADDTRAAICLALMDGRAWTAGELARHAGVAASTATEHLSKLVDGGLLLEERQGRHRYVRLAGADVAKLIEDMTLFMAKPAPVQSSLRAHRASKALAYARTCYDHMAGHLGVAITGSLIQRGLLDDLELTLTEQGRSWFADSLN